MRGLRRSPRPVRAELLEVPTINAAYRVALPPPRLDGARAATAERLSAHSRSADDGEEWKTVPGGAMCVSHGSRLTSIVMPRPLRVPPPVKKRR